MYSILPHYLPLLQALPDYDRRTFRADAIAGVTVALVSLPQAIGFALMAGLPPQMVIASLLIGGFFAALFVSSHQTVFGPTNTFSLFLANIVYASTSTSLGPIQIAILVGFLIGVIQLSAGIARLGNLTQFVSRSVILGYSTGVAILIAVGQLPNLAGIAIERGGNLLQILWKILLKILEFGPHAQSLELGLACLLSLILISRWRPAWPEALIVLVASTALAGVLDLNLTGVRNVANLGALTASWPSFAGWPLGSAALAEIPHLVNACLALAVLGMIEAISISKSLASRTGQQIRPNQELLAMGAGNLMASCFGAMPGSASFTRSAVNQQTGGRTQFSSIFAALAVGAALLVVVPLANLIPIPCVAAVLLVIAYEMIPWDQIRIATRSTRSDRLVYVATLAGTLVLPLDTAIYLGVAISLALFLRKAASPTLVEYGFNDSGLLTALAESARPNPQISIVHVEGDLFFGAADLFQDGIRTLAAQENIRVFILRMKNARHLDGSTALALVQLIGQLQSQGRHLLISGVHGDVAQVLRNSGIVELLGRENVFPADQNPNLATKRALQRAQALLGPVKADVRLFYDQVNVPA